MKSGDTPPDEAGLRMGHRAPRILKHAAEHGIYFSGEGLGYKRMPDRRQALQ